jgi:hypothetical protein
LKYLLFLILCLSCKENYDIKKEKIIKKEYVSECQTLKRELVNEENIINIPDEYIDNLFYAKSHPVLFEREPLFISSKKKVIKLRERIDKENNPWPIIEKLTKILKKQELRELILKEGYLYSSNKNESYALTQLIKIEDLFSEKEVYLTRGSDTFKLLKTNNGYIFSDGFLKNQKASILLYDKLYLKEKPDIHLDLLYLRQNFIYNKIIKIYKNKNYLFLKVDEEEIIIKDKNIICGKLEKTSTNINSLKLSMIDMVDDKLPFDEPIHEFGKQLDGQLRPRWEKAFFQKQKSYIYNGDKYNVMFNGKPYVPQVCVDFVFDTIDRASGTWYSNNKRVVGSFDSKYYKDKYNIRSISGLIRLAEDNNDLFEVKKFKSEKFKSKNFYKDLKFNVGDIILIKGYTPWDKKEEHFHSFFIFETDPIYNIPFLLAGNAGPASLRVWEVERKRTPERFIFTIITPKQKILSLLKDNYNKIIIR